MQQAIAPKIISRITDANLHCAFVQYTLCFSCSGNWPPWPRYPPPTQEPLLHCMQQLNKQRHLPRNPSRSSEFVAHTKSQSRITFPSLTFHWKFSHISFDPHKIKLKDLLPLNSTSSKTFISIGSRFFHPQMVACFFEEKIR